MTEAVCGPSIGDPSQLAAPAWAQVHSLVLVQSAFTETSPPSALVKGAAPSDGWRLDSPGLPLFSVPWEAHTG